MLCSQQDFKDKKIKMINSLSQILKLGQLIIIANRKSIELDDFDGEIFSRDIYNEN